MLQVIPYSLYDDILLPKSKLLTFMIIIRKRQYRKLALQTVGSIMPCSIILTRPVANITVKKSISNESGINIHVIALRLSRYWDNIRNRL